METNGYTYKVEGKIIRTYYVYGFFVNDKPFYIGVGKRRKNLQRYEDHLWSNNTKSLFIRTLYKMKKEKVSFKICILYNSDTREKVLDKECKLIKKFGKKGSRNGNLCNITNGGDGGDTISGKYLAYNTRTLEQKYVKRLPSKEWKYGALPNKPIPRINCYNPETGQASKIYSNDELPKGWKLGYPKNRLYGPRGQKIIHNVRTKERRWIKQNEKIPKGWKLGSCTSSTKNKLSYYNELLDKVIFLEKGIKPPKGYKLGTRPRQTNKIIIEGNIFISISQACKFFNLSRYKLQKTYEIKEVKND